MVSKIKWDIPLHTGSLTPFPVMQAEMQDGHSPSSQVPLLGNTHGPCAIICGGCSDRGSKWNHLGEPLFRHRGGVHLSNLQEKPSPVPYTNNPNTVHCSSHSSGQISDESLSGAAPAFFTAQVSARDGGGNTGFLAFLLIFPGEITVCQGQCFLYCPTGKPNSL